MRVLAINTGSSSLKYELFRVEAEGRAEPLAGGVVERIGESGSRVMHRCGGRAHERTTVVGDHAAAVSLACDLLSELGDPPPLAGAVAPDATGHRIVHGGEAFSGPVLVDETNLGRVEACAALAPLHAGPNLAGLHAARRRYPDAPAVAVFDTAFFHPMPPGASHYAVPHEWAATHGVRRYGFHGTSHCYVAGRAAELLGTTSPDLVTLHLGNGCSAACIRGGIAADTSMGFSPLEGLVMGTRCGDIDPAVVFHLSERGLSLGEIRDGLERRGGLLGLSGVSSDVRDVHAAAARGDQRAALALDVFVRRVRRYLGAYLLELERCDAIVFTGGIGENDAALRARILAGLEHRGIEVDPARNGSGGPGERAIHREGGSVPIWVVPTDEERSIALETADLVGRSTA